MEKKRAYLVHLSPPPPLLLREMVREGAVEGVELDSSPTPTFCEACVQGKAHRKNFPKVSETTYSKYGSREPRVAFLKAKSDAFDSYKFYEAWVKVHRNANGIVCLGSDRWGRVFK
jgi:hypothetical protein